ncbi:MAG: DUF72 domain-containing protein [Bacteroidia bacterium]
MKFGKIADPSEIDFSLPAEHSDTIRILQKQKKTARPPVYIGCAKWNRQDLKGFYPRGTKDELAYYATQFNSIELNATFYQQYDAGQMEKWKQKVPQGFRFYPKIPQRISHFGRLSNVEALTETTCECYRAFGENLGITFLQMPDNFGPKNFDRLESFLQNWPGDMRLALELRNKLWYKDSDITDRLCHLMEQHAITHVLTDTAGRRDLLHMRFTTPFTFIRYVGANHESDYTRIDDWFKRLKQWIAGGVQEINFFIHQNLEKESPLLSAKLVKRFNEELGYDLPLPAIAK